MNELIESITSISPTVGLWLVINIVLIYLKRAPSIPNWTLPFLASIIGGTVYPLISDPGKISFTVRYPILIQVIQGIIIGFAATGLHQAFKQWMNRFGISTGDTEVLTRNTNEKTNPNPAPLPGPGSGTP